MPWFRKRQVSTVPATTADAAPADLPVELDAQLFRMHHARLLEVAGGDGGIASHLAGLADKQAACAAALDRARSGGIGMGDVERLLGGVFTARRRLYPALESLGVSRISALVAGLADAGQPVALRIQAFADAMPGASGTDREDLRTAAKLRRAAWDFASDLLHYGDPERYPLMSRWVWDPHTQSGALREFVRGGDAMRDLPFSGDPGAFQAARRWLAERIACEGICRDVPFWIDLVQAQAYLSYVRSVTEGNLGGDFGRGTPPAEQLRKLLGIDASGTRGRVLKRAAA